MNQSPENENRPHLEDPEHFGEHIDAVVAELAGQPELETGIDWLMNRQKELYQDHYNKRLAGERLLPKDEQELEDITTSLLALQRLVEKYRPEE